MYIIIGCNGEALQIHDHADSLPPPETLAEYVDNSEVVVKGRYTEMLDKVNMIAEDEKMQIPSSDFYAEGHVYEFTVTEVFKGEPTELISVILPFKEVIDIFDDNGNHVDEIHIESSNMKNRIKIKNIFFS